MRIQLRLSIEARVILEEIKIEFLKNQGLNVTYGHITNTIFNEMQNDFKRIDWISVRDSKEFDAILSDYKKINPTALSLTDDTIQSITDLTKIINIQFGMTRTVYRSFVIRIVLKAYKMNENAYNIFK